MDADLFLQQFGHLAQGEGGIKKLRDVILQLAVRGKLVEQNPADEPAEILLKKIEAAKKQLIKDGAVKEIKTPPAKVDDILPRGWRWVKLADVAYPQAGFAFKSGGFNEAKIGMPLIRIRDVGTSNPHTYYQGEYRPEFVVNHGDYLIGMDGDFRVAKWLGSEALLNQRVSRLIFYYDAMPHSLVAIALQIELYKLQGVKAYTTVDHLSGKQIAESVIALPPLAEQKRIVAKVDELMALCDKLEGEQKAQRTLKTEAVQSTLHHLTSAESPTSFGTSLNILERTFGNWFDNLATVKHLRATILQLAVQGKLVPQNPADEPASELLKRIEAERKQPTKQAKKKSEDSYNSVSKIHQLTVPNGWELVTLGDLIKISSGDGLTSANMSKSGSIPVYGGNGITGMHDAANTFEATIVIGRVGYYCGSIHITAEKAWITDNAFRTDFSKKNIDPNFLYWLLKATNLQQNNAATAQPVISGAKVYPLQVLFPPLAEQKRIVVKVDELIMLCDQLEAHITQAQTLNTHLMDSLIHRMAA